MIPHIIHRIWLEDPMPPAVRRFGDRWRELHPTWEVMDWTSRGYVEALGLPAGDVRARAKAVLPGDWKRFEADVLRLELLYRFGGLYVDTDVEPLIPIDALLDGHKCLVARSPQTDGYGYHAITNCVVAAAPNHPWIKALLDGLTLAIEQHGHQHLARMIGPWHLDRTYSSRHWPDVHVIYWPQMGNWLTHYWNNQRRRRGVGIA
jgi:mannosyltransferase OCH1-like enzyme